MSVFDIVTERMIQALEQGDIPWKRPWVCVEAGNAHNFFNKKRYSLLNSLLLPCPGAYASFLQWQSAGYRIRKGEKAAIIVFWKYNTIENADDALDDEDNDDKKKKYPILKYYRVYHTSQLLNPPEEQDSERELFNTDPIPQAQMLFDSYTERENIQVISECSNRAYYSPATDTIVLPNPQQFESAALLASVSFHEAIHSTGSKQRLNRIGLQSISFGSEEYSKEELIAEIGSAALLNDLGIETEASIDNSSAYVQGWLKALRDDKKMIVYAAAQAEKAVSFLKTGTVQ